MECYLKMGITTRPTRGNALFGLLLIVIPTLLISFTSPHPRHHNLNIPPTAISTPTISNTALHARRNIVVVSHNVSRDVADGFFDVNTLLTGRVDVLTRCISSSLWISNGIRRDTSVFLMLFPHNITIEVRGEKVRGLNPDERTTALYLQRALLDADGDASSEPASSDEEDISLLSQKQRRELKLKRLQGRDLSRPKTINPYKPGARSKAQKEDLRSIRKRRESIARQIQRSAKAGTPHGFILHENDTLESRLKILLSSSDGNAFMMDELGEPLLDVLTPSLDTTSDDERKTRANTTIILGDQIGYSPCDEKILSEFDAVRKVSLGPVSLLTSQCITIAHNCLDLREN